MQLPSSPTEAQEAYAIAAELESIAQQLVDQASAVMLRVERLQEQLSQSAQQELRLTQPQAGKIKRAKLLCVVHDRLPTYAKPGSTYRVRDFRKFCEPVLRPHLSALDYELDADNRPKWHGRFDYAHKDVARDLGCVIVSNGVWRAP